MWTCRLWKSNEELELDDCNEGGAINDEKKNKTWILVERLRDGKVIGVKWVYRTELNVDGPINKNKARLVVKGYNQIFGMDYSDTFAPVAWLDTIRLLLVVVTQKD